MKEKRFVTLSDIDSLKLDGRNRFFSASDKEIKVGLTSDIYFVRTRDLLEWMGYGDTIVTAEVFSSKAGILAGIEEAKYLLEGCSVKVWSVPEGEPMQSGEVVMRIEGLYSEFGIYETPLLGILASSSGWATAARECKEAASGKKVICYGARHLHPSVAPVMERCAITGGVDGCSCILAALMLGRKPVGTIPHAAFLIAGDTLKVSEAYDQFMPDTEPRIILVDTFKDEAEETLRIASSLKEKLTGIRLDTPGERGGVTPGLVREIRARLDQAGYKQVQIVTSGGLKPERIEVLSSAGADAFGVGSYISRAAAIDMTMDIKKIGDKDIAKRGRIPGISNNERLVKMK